MGAIEVVEEFEIMIGIVLVMQSARFKSSVYAIPQCLSVLVEGSADFQSSIVHRSLLVFGKTKTYSVSKHGIGTHAKASRSNLQFLETASAGELPQS